ncbi:MAG: hypothetical protein IT377_17085, partial [Polyangiaceae bacterium]|nr:hypothetical protein [Polyangiaceae bacterium]
MSAPVERAARAVMALQAAGLAIGVVTQALIAHHFGTSRDLGLYTVAVALVSFLADWFLRDAVLMALVPPLRALRTGGGGDADAARARTVAVAFGVGALIVSAALAVASDAVVRALAPGFGADEVARAAHLLRALLPALPLAVIGSCLQAELQAEARFALPTAATIARSAVLAVVVLLGAPWLGIFALPIGVVGGHVLAVALQREAAPSVWAWLTQPLRARSPRVWLTELIPVGGMLALGAAGHVNLLTDRWFASRLPAEALARLGYAERFRFPIMALFALSVSGPALTYLSEAAAQRDWTAARRTLASAAGLVARTALPALVVMMVVRGELVAVWLERGEFSAADTAEVASILGCLIPAFAVNAFSPLLIAAFFALGQTRPLLVVVALEMLGNVALDALWVGRFGLQGVAFATTV